MSRRVPLLTRLFGGARIPSSVTVGHWTQIGHGVVLGDRVRLGDWSRVGEGSVIGADCVFGPWARVGANVTLGAGVRLGSHTRVQDGVTVPDGAVFADCDLVTHDGVVPNRTGGYAYGLLGQAAMVSSPFGVFLIPFDEDLFVLPTRHEDRHHAVVEQMIEDHQWGRSDALDLCRVPHPPAPSELGEMIRAVRQRQKRAHLRVVPGEPDRGQDDDQPSP
jgi:hypothetical protein